MIDSKFVGDKGNEAMTTPCSISIRMLNDASVREVRTIDDLPVNEPFTIIKLRREAEKPTRNMSIMDLPIMPDDWVGRDDMYKLTSNVLEIERLEAGRFRIWRVMLVKTDGRFIAYRWTEA